MLVLKLLLQVLEMAGRARQFSVRAPFRGGSWPYSSLARLALLEDAKTLPLGAAWDEHCRRSNVPEGFAWLDAVSRYERAVLSRRP